MAPVNNTTSPTDEEIEQYMAENGITSFAAALIMWGIEQHGIPEDVDLG